MKSFKKFIDAELKKSQQLNGIDREKCIREYLNLVSDLYSKVDNTWLADYIPDKISTGLEQMIVTERNIGSYEVSKKWIKVGDSILYMLPIGTDLIGAKARVDLVLGAKSIMLLWLNQEINDIYFSSKSKKRAESHKEENFTWKFVFRNGSTKFQDVDTDSFQNSIMDLING